MPKQIIFDRFGLNPVDDNEKQFVQCNYCKKVFQASLFENPKFYYCLECRKKKRNKKV